MTEILSHRVRSLDTPIGTRIFTDFSIRANDGSVYGFRSHGGIARHEVETEGKLLESRIAKRSRPS